VPECVDHLLAAHRTRASAALRRIAWEPVPTIFTFFVSRANLPADEGYLVLVENRGYTGGADQRLTQANPESVLRFD
jgi:hypothetical protein